MKLPAKINDMLETRREITKVFLVVFLLKGFLILLITGVLIYEENTKSIEPWTSFDSLVKQHHLIAYYLEVIWYFVFGISYFLCGCVLKCAKNSSVFAILTAALYIFPFIPIIGSHFTEEGKSADAVFKKFQYSYPIFYAHLFIGIFIVLVAAFVIYKMGVAAVKEIKEERENEKAMHESALDCMRNVEEAQARGVVYSDDDIKEMKKRWNL